MSAVEEIKEAMRQLTPEDLAAFRVFPHSTKLTPT